MQIVNEIFILPADLYFLFSSEVNVVRHNNWQDLLCAGLLSRQVFSDSLDLAGLLRSVLLSQPCEQQDLKVVISDEVTRETVSVLLDLQPRQETCGLDTLLTV